MDGPGIIAADRDDGPGFQLYGMLLVVVLFEWRLKRKGGRLAV